MSHQLRSMMAAIMDWCKTWQVQLNINKCAVLRCSYMHHDAWSSSSVSFDFVIDGKVITSTDQHSYNTYTYILILFVALNFIRRNLSKIFIDVKSTAYLSLVRPIMEYAACIWDPYQKYLTNNIEGWCTWLSIDGPVGLLSTIWYAPSATMAFFKSTPMHFKAFTVSQNHAPPHYYCCLHTILLFTHHIQPDNYILILIYHPIYFHNQYQL